MFNFMIVILIVYIIRVRIFQRNFLGIGRLTKEFPFLSVRKSKKKKQTYRNRPIAALGRLVKQVTYIMLQGV
jgi:hypothetical protein